ncbi:marvel domain-containing protein [Clohesyomyces aquaticus]|uniref:Marvel domain-containing protein n=1 Tax=Clohesyomyces aquaticus TaxID=1231657 RepID=A0A1Y1ZFS2_9PLEO|nr:marvel domain-containing protein [Clohesyomyces aquaticus]
MVAGVGVVFLGIRVTQFIFAAVVLSMASALLKQQIGSPPSITQYSAFTGALGLLTACFGITAVWYEPLKSLAMAAIDLLMALFYAAGGIIMFIQLKDISCSDNGQRNIENGLNNPIVNGGCPEGACEGFGEELILTRCKKASTDAAFQVTSFLVLLGAAALTYRQMKRT